MVLLEFRDQSLIAALSIRDRCVALMARLYRLYCFRGSWVISKTVLQPLGVPMADHTFVSNPEKILESALVLYFFNNLGD